MKVKYHGLETNLADALQPRGYHDYGQGQLEDIGTDIRALQESFGRLLTHMLTHDRLTTVEQAAEIVGCHYEIEELP